MILVHHEDGIIAEALVADHLIAYVPLNGTVEGYIGDEMVGDKGFGYDPIFMVDEDHSMAELDQDEKNRISHRAKAFEELAKILKEKFS